jgi:two-component system, sensor histidine kinase and response regulator
LKPIADSGPAALEALQNAAFDIVLMDVQMPGMDGFEVTRTLRAEPRLAHLPVIAMTAYAMERDRQRCLAAGMNDFVTKPIEPAELFAVVSRWLPSPASPTDAVRQSAEVGHVDFDEGRRRCLGRSDLYDRIVERFLSSRFDDGKRLVQAFQDGDMATIRVLAHTVASTAGTLGAQRLSGLAQELQRALLEGAETVSISVLVQSFAAEHELVVEELRVHDQREEA